VAVKLTESGAVPEEGEAVAVTESAGSAFEAVILTLLFAFAPELSVTVRVAV
jgi:hypothetical protein